MEEQKSLEAIIMSSLSTLTPLQLSKLTHHFSSVYHRYHHRILSLLSSPTLFSLTLHHLNSLSLHHKSLLIGRHLLSKLAILTYFMQKNTILPPRSTTSMNLRDVDAVLLLLLLCNLRQHEPGALDAPPSCWRDILRDYMAKDILKLSNIEGSSSEVILKFIELVAKCKDFVNAMAYDGGDQGYSYGEGKEGKKLAASVAVVVALPSVEASGGENECVVCKEDMKLGRDICKLPCDHLFHWKCILPWLKKTNTCPCCRFQLPSDDVFAETQRLWDVLAKMSGAT
ncbi:E3 ubiquitin-protein ligase SGR9, amyloplastic-like [Lycium ferocissimum]|uniref:E3 ubiquitin-protein ligase SGR9, amyloplastic-like n=1 Tax=Lycium ferocissimum TaxID=112874 RepID=UPI0028163B4A|nr:E3 ubiquitin-protein ligase SGR9, amyloplastic-like [Lycium ferocissimum]